MNERCGTANAGRLVAAGAAGAVLSVLLLTWWAWRG